MLPVEALRDSTPGAERPSRRRGVIGFVILVAGVGAMLASLYAGAAFMVFGIGLAAALLGVIVALPLVVRPLAALIATLLRAGCPVSWRSRTRRATRGVPPRRPP